MEEMNRLDNIFLIVLFIILAIAVIAILLLFKSLLKSKEKKNTEIFFSGGANIDDGRFLTDKNYFKGISGNLKDTVVIDNNNAHKSNHGISVTLKNRSDKRRFDYYIKNQLIIGRTKTEGIFSINDSTVSLRHCVLTVSGNMLVLSDLNSANHTYLNGRQIYRETEVHSGDVIRIGNTKLEIFF